MLQRILISFLFIFTLQSAVVAQVKKHDTITGPEGKVDVATETRKEKTQEKRLYSPAQFVKESFLFVKQPLRWKGKDWLKVGAIGAGTALLTFADQPLRTATQTDQKYFYSVPIVGGRVYGEWYTIVGMAGTFGTYGLMARDTTAKKIAIELLQSGLYSEAVTIALKIIVGRARPYEDLGPGTFHPFTWRDAGFNSFPSGHSTSAFALSTVMSRHANTTALKIIAYVPAAFTLFSRIYQDEHWISDELVSAGIGFFVGNWVVDLHEAKRHRINVQVTSMYPPGISIDLDSFSLKRRHVTATPN